MLIVFLKLAEHKINEHFLKLKKVLKAPKSTGFLEVLLKKTC